MIRVATIKDASRLAEIQIFSKTMMFPLMKCRYCVLHYIIRML